jgi:molecular chaperone DnaK (HSP70)
LPLVGELVSQAYKTSRVILTDKPYTSVAMGAAIGATERVRYRDVFARHFGLIRLRDHGRLETFDIVFPAGTPIPRKGEPPLETVTRYQPQHNIGHLRYLECTEVDTTGMPTGNLRQWSDIVFPYDPSEPLAKNAVPSEIVATDAFADQIVCEVYRCDHDGVITVELQRPATEERRTYEIFSD